MIHKMMKWMDKNDDMITQVIVFGLAITLAVGMISLSFIL